MYNVVVRMLVIWSVTETIKMIHEEIERDD